MNHFYAFSLLDSSMRHHGITHGFSEKEAMERLKRTFSNDISDVRLTLLKSDNIVYLSERAYEYILDDEFSIQAYLDYVDN